MAAREPEELAADVRLQTAAAVRGVDPALAQRLIDKTVRDAAPQTFPGLLMLLIANDKAAATRYFRGIPFSNPAAPWDRWLVLRCIMNMAGADPAEASAAAQKLPIPKDVPEYRRAVAALLHVIDTPAYERRPDLVAADISALSKNDAVNLVRQLISTGIGAPVAAAPEPAAMQIAPRLKALRNDQSKSERAALAESFAVEIRALHDPQSRLGLATSLSNLATEGDLGTKALQAVTDTLGQAIRDAKPKVSGGPILTLAKLVRYEHMKSPIEDPSLDSRLELLRLRELTTEQADFKLSGIDGKTYSLKNLRGKVVVVNFWATWCPPCRKEMPDLEELSRRYRDRGLVILAISDEPADTVKPFIAKQGYTFPVLLDPNREVNTAFHVEGIPKTFVFDREGKLAAQSIDMRTREQFLALLKQAGLD